MNIPQQPLDVKTDLPLALLLSQYHLRLAFSEGTRACYPGCKNIFVPLGQPIFLLGSKETLMWARGRVAQLRLLTKQTCTSSIKVVSRILWFRVCFSCIFNTLIIIFIYHRNSVRASEPILDQITGLKSMWTAIHFLWPVNLYLLISGPTMGRHLKTLSYYFPQHLQSHFKHFNQYLILSLQHYETMVKDCPVE